MGSISQTLTVPGIIDSPTDVDLYAFDVAAGQRISFDIDQAPAFDSFLRLFDSVGRELAASDDKAGPGELSSLNSYLEYSFTNSGTFYLGVSGFSNTNYDAVTGAGDSAGLQERTR